MGVGVGEGVHRGGYLLKWLSSHILFTTDDVSWSILTARIILLPSFPAINLMKLPSFCASSKRGPGYNRVRGWEGARGGRRSVVPNGYAIKRGHWHG